MTSGLKVTLIADGSTAAQRLARRWGVAYLIGKDVLFDTFGEAGVFMSNLERLNIDAARVRHIVISHDHWDHVAGLWPFLEENRNAAVYLCPGFGPEVKEKLAEEGAAVVEVSGPREIVDGVYTTGPVRGRYQNKDLEEQAVVIRINEELALITGCAHPGVTAFLERSAATFGRPVSRIIGGFHLKETPRTEIERLALRWKDMGVREVTPLHCTGETARAVFDEVFKDGVIDLREGDRL